MLLTRETDSVDILVLVVTNCETINITANQCNSNIFSIFDVNVRSYCHVNACCETCVELAAVPAAVASYDK